MALQIRRRANLVYVVTAEFRERLISELRERLQRAKAAADAVEKAIQETADAGQTGSIDRLRSQQSKLARARDTAAARLAQVESLKEGSEVTEGAVDLICEIKTGDSADRLGDAQIVIRDGVICEIRNP